MFYIYFVSLSLKVRLDYSSLKTDNKEKIDNMETKTKQLEHQLVCVIATVVIGNSCQCKSNNSVCLDTSETRSPNGAHNKGCILVYTFIIVIIMMVAIVFPSSSTIFSFF